MNDVDRAKIGDLELIVRDGKFEIKYRGKDAFESREGLKSVLSLYKGEEIKSEKGKKFEFHGEIKYDFEKMERLGYSTNNVIATENMVIKTYRNLGSREAELMRILGGIAPKVLGYGLYDGKYIQIITKRYSGEDVGKMIWENRKKFLNGDDWKRELDDILLLICETVAEMHGIMEKMGIERITSEDIKRWRENVEHLAKNAGVKLNKNAEKLFDSHIDKKKIEIHGDLHFGQMLFHHGKIIITDFEGEPLEKREKLPYIRDMATLSRALGYISLGAWDEWERYGVKKIYEFYPNELFTEREYYEWMFQRALYELNYEKQFRKENMEIPLRGVNYIGRILEVID